MISPARRAAYDIGLAVARGRSDLADAIALSRRALGDDRDKALAAEIAIGVQRWRAALDHLIAHFSSRPLRKLDAEVVEILRLSTYQLLHLERVPAAAVVDDAVKMTGRAGKGSASGLVNAVLRSISRHRRALPLPSRPAGNDRREDVLGYLAITLSHPQWLVERWYDRYGFEATEKWLQFNNYPAPLTLRINRRRITDEALARELDRSGVITTNGRYAPDARLVEKGRPLGTPGIDKGWFVVQDEASQLVTLLAGRDPGRRVLDTCASPGGKTTALSATMADEGLLVACDVRDRRMALLKRTVNASGATNVRFVQADLLTPLPFGPIFDTVFVDVPCSGLGTLRRDPDIKWTRQPSHLPVLAQSQLTMLRHAAQAVRAGGRLIYATCSSEPDENEEVVAAFTSTSFEFNEVDARAAGLPLPSDVIDANGRLRTYPHVHGLEAFFGAIFVRRASG